MFFTVFGSLTFATSSIVMNHLAWSGGESWGFGFVGLSPLVVSGGLVTLGGLLLHFGQERRWAHADWEAGRGPIDRTAAPRPGAGLLLAGPLTLAGSATIFTWGLVELTHLDVECGPKSGPYDDCWEGNTRTAAALISTSGAGLLVGVSLIVLGARQRARYMDWRVGHARPIKLRPTPWASVRGFGLGLQGQF